MENVFFSLSLFLFLFFFLVLLPVFLLIVKPTALTCDRTWCCISVWCFLGYAMSRDRTRNTSKSLRSIIYRRKTSNLRVKIISVYIVNISLYVNTGRNMQNTPETIEQYWKKMRKKKQETQSWESWEKHSTLNR